VMILLATVLAGTFSFSGGGDSNVCECVGRTCNLPVCIFVDPTRIWKKSEFRYANQDELRLILKRRYSLDFPDAYGVGASSDGAYPSTFFHKQRNDRYSALHPPKRVNLTQLTFPLTIDAQTTQELTTEDIQALRKSKPVKFHWFFSAARLSIACKNLGESDFLSMVSHALGGKLISTRDSFTVDFDPSAFRARAVKLFRESAAASHINANINDDNFLATLYSALSNAQLAKLYSAPNEQLELHIDYGSELWSAAMERVWDRIGPKDADEASLSTGQRESRKLFLDHVDFSLGIWALIRPDGVPSCVLKGKNWQVVF
jgi:hypothetical protein